MLRKQLLLGRVHVIDDGVVVPHNQHGVLSKHPQVLLVGTGELFRVVGDSHVERDQDFPRIHLHHKLQ